MHETFITKRFNASTQEMIAQANAILGEFHGQGYTMTLRQLHYQFVRHNFYKNTKKNYKRLGSAMSDGRLAGLVDWDMMEDRVRELDRSPRWQSPSDIVEAIADQYKEDAWKGQKLRPEVWIEKDALAGIIEAVCRELRIDFFACRGYVSQSAQYEASKRFLRYIQNGQRPIVLHFGDHDPSGLDMTRENRVKFQLLTGHEIEVRRLALNIEQVRAYNPPPNYAKVTDTRAQGYIREFGNQSWELDALDPPVLQALIRDEIEPLIDRKIWNRAIRAEEANRTIIAAVSNRWDEVAEFVA